MFETWKVPPPGRDQTEGTACSRDLPTLGAITDGRDGVRNGPLVANQTDKQLDASELAGQLLSLVGQTLLQSLYPMMTVIICVCLMIDACNYLED